MVKKYTYYIDRQTEIGTEFYLFSDDFIKMINESLQEQNKSMLKDCINTSKPYKIYKEAMQIDCK